MKKKSDDLSSLTTASPEDYQKISDELTDLLSAIASKSGQDNSILLNSEFIEKMKQDDEIQSLFSNIIQHHPFLMIYVNEQKTLQITIPINLKQLTTTLSEESVWHFLFMNCLNENNENQYMNKLIDPEGAHNKSFYSRLPSQVTQSSLFLQSFNTPFGAKVFAKVMHEFKDQLMVELFTNCCFDVVYHPELANVVFSEQNIKKNTEIFKKMALNDVQTLANNCLDFYSNPLFFSSLDPQDSISISKLYPVVGELLIRKMDDHLSDRGFMKDYMSSKIHQHFWLWSGDFIWSYTQKRMTWEEILNSCLFFENENVGYEFMAQNPEDTCSKISYLKNELLAVYPQHGDKKEFEKCSKALDKISTYMNLSLENLASFEAFLSRNPTAFRDDELGDYKYQPFQSKSVQAFNLWMPKFKSIDNNNRAIFDELLLFTAYHSPGSLYPYSDHLMDWIQETSTDNKKRLQQVFLTHLVLGDSERLFTGMNYKTAITWDAWTYRKGFEDYLFTPELFPEIESARHPFLKLSADVFHAINLWDDFSIQQKLISEQKRPHHVRTLPYLLSYRSQYANALHLPHAIKRTKEPEAKPTQKINRF